MRPGSGARAYLGVAFLVVAVLVALAAAAGLTALRGEEASGRLDHLLARPVGRSGWLLGRIGTAAAGVISGGLLAGVAAWMGARATGASVGLGSLLQAGANVLPPALVVLGLGVLTFGIRPRVTAAACYALVAWSFLVLMVGTVLRANHWLLDTSLFRHISAAPAVDPDWTSAAVLVAVALVSTAIGAACFQRRDLAGE